MKDTFLARLLYVFVPVFGAGPVDKAGTFILWVITLLAGDAQGPIAPPPAWLPSWVAPLLGVLATLLTAYHVAHPDTAAGVAKL